MSAPAEDDRIMRPDVMCLRQLSLHNYRMFSDLSITFPDMSDDRADGDCEGAAEVEGDRGADGRGNWVTVIVGENGSGKTSILDAAIIALGTYLVKIPDIDKPTFNRTDARLARIEMHNTSTMDYQQKFPVSVSAHGDVMGNSPSWARSLKSANGRTAIGDAPEMVRISDFYQRQVREGKMIHLPLIASYGTDRLWPRDRSKWATHSTAYLHTQDRRAHDGAVPTVPDSGPRRHGPAG